jgi:hypothetical protein
MASDLKGMQPGSETEESPTPVVPEVIAAPEESALLETTNVVQSPAVALSFARALPAQVATVRKAPHVRSQVFARQHANRPVEFVGNQVGPVEVEINLKALERAGKLNRKAWVDAVENNLQLERSERESLLKAINRTVYFRRAG